MDERLSAQVRRKIGVTWSKPETDARIDEDMIPSAKLAVADKVGMPPGAEFDFSKPGRENTLLLAWCFYEWNDAIDDFDGNYADTIAQARRHWEVVALAEKEELPDV